MPQISKQKQSLKMKKDNFQSCLKMNENVQRMSNKSKNNFKKTKMTNFRIKKIQNVKENMQNILKMNMEGSRWV